MSIMRNRYVVTALVLLLSSCQSAGPTKQAVPVRSSTWQVLERVGEAHARAPGASDWAEIMARDEIPAASMLVTGTGGRLILARPGRQIVVGTKTRLRLPNAEGKVALEQTEGRVRYRIARSPTAFAVATPALNVQATDTVLEVAVGAESTEVTVEAGEARVATFDGQSVGVVAAGGSARAGGARDVGLMVRGAPGQAYERFEPVLASRRQPTLEPSARRSLEARTGASAVPSDPAPAATVAATAAAPPKQSSGARASRAGPARVGDDVGAAERVIVPAAFRRSPDEHTAAASAGADTKGAGEQPDMAEDISTSENDGTVPPPADPFTGFTDGLLGSLHGVSPR